MPLGSYTANTYTANGVTTVFAYSWKIFDASQLKVDVAGVTQGSGYTVDGIGEPNGGNVTFSSAPANGATVFIYRDTPYTRTEDYQTNGDLKEETLDRDLDTREMQIQQVADLAARSIHVPRGSTANTELPAPQGGSAFGWNAAGTAIINILLSTGTTLANLAASSGSSLIGFIQAGVSAILRTVQDKARDRVDVRDFVTITGTTTDISAGLTAALAAHDTVYIPAATVLVKEVVIGTHKRVICEGTILKPAASASYMFKLTGFKPMIQGGYIDAASDNITHGTTTNAAIIVDDSTYPTIDDFDFVNVFGGMLVKATAGETKGGKFSRLRFDTVEDRCALTTKNVNTCTWTDLRGYVGTVPSGGLEIPKVNCIGFQIVSTGSTVAAGGHIIGDADFEQCGIAFQFTDVELSDVSDSFGDSCSTSAFQCTGACSGITFSDCYAGTTLKGFDIAGTSQAVIKGVETRFIGVVPPWGDPAAFFTAGSPFAISISNTAVGDVDNAGWMGDRSLFVESTAAIRFSVCDFLYTNSVTNIAAGATAFLGPQGQTAAEVAPWIAPRDGVALTLTTQQAAAPGAAQSSTDTFRKAGADSTLVATTSGGASFGATANGLIFFSKGDNMSIKSLQSGGAAATTHRYVLTVAYYGAP